FGWKTTAAMDMGPAGMYWMFGRGAGSLGGMYNKSRDMPGAPHWLCYVLVPDADTAAATVTRLGGRVVRGPMEVAGGSRIAMCVYAQGAAFAVHSQAPAKPRAKPKPKKKAARPKAKEKAAKRKASKKRRR